MYGADILYDAALMPTCLHAHCGLEASHLYGRVLHEADCK